MFASNASYQKCKGGYFVWKHHACWDKQDQNYAMEISDKPMFKVEEAMLNYIEAKYVLNGTVSQTDVDATINKLRDRAEVGRMNLGDITDSFDPDRNPEIDPVLWEIRRERLITGPVVCEQAALRSLCGKCYGIDDQLSVVWRDRYPCRRRHD